MEKKNVVLLTVIAVATLLITVVGATFAYFAATITNQTEPEKITITSANDLTITYNDGTTIEGENILPGWGETYDKANKYEMTVVNNSRTSDITYNMNWDSVLNSITDKENLTFKATAKTEWDEGATLQAEGNTAAIDPAKEGKQFPNAGSTDAFVTGQTLKPGEKITYTITVAYKYAETEQDSKGASFSGKIAIDKDSIRAKTHVAAGA